MKQGGKRTNSGRKAMPEHQKKIQVTMYIERWRLDLIGGVDGFKEMAEEMLPTRKAGN